MFLFAAKSALTLFLTATPVSGSCTWAGTGVGSCYDGENIDEVSCDYAHPSEFSDDDWHKFNERCRRLKGPSR